MPSSGKSSFRMIRRFDESAYEIRLSLSVTLMLMELLVRLEILIILETRAEGIPG